MTLAAAPASALHDVAPFSPAAAPCPALAQADLQDRLLRAGREALDQRELLQLLLAAAHPADEAERLSRALLDTFGTAPRVLAARADTLRAIAGLSIAAIAIMKSAEALGILMAEAALPQRFHAQLATYEKVVDYCRSLSAHRDTEELRALYLNSKNHLIREECLQSGTINYTPVYPRQVCIRALEVGAAAVVVLHPHPSGDPTPSGADVEMTKRLRDALKTIDVDLHDHVVVTPSDAFSFKEKGLL